MGRYFLLYGKGNGNARAAFGGPGAKGKGSKGSEGSKGGSGGLRRKIKGGAPDGAGCVEGLCSLRSRGDSGFAAEGKVVASPQFIAPFHRKGVAP